MCGRQLQALVRQLASLETLHENHRWILGTPEICALEQRSKAHRFVEPPGARVEGVRMRWGERLDVKPDAAPARRLRLEVSQKGGADALAVKLWPHCHEVDFKGVGIVLREGARSADLGATAGQPRRESI